MVDLDAANEMEQEEMEDDEIVTYKIGEPIYAYHTDHVKNR
jgi:hypothetical protein